MQDELPGLLSGQKVVDGDLTDDGPVLDERHVLTGLKGGKTLYWRPSTTRGSWMRSPRARIAALPTTVLREGARGSVTWKQRLREWVRNELGFRTAL